MSGFDYGNTRLRVMKSRLFARDELLGFAALGSVDRFLNALTRTPYRSAVEAALVQFSGLDCLNRALQDDLIRGGSVLRGFFDGRAGAQVAWVLRRYDIHNLKTVLRGLAQRRPAAAVLEALVPLGELRTDELALLAGAEDMQAAVDLLATWRSPFARPFLARDGLPSTLFGRELQLERWYVAGLLAAPEVRESALYDWGRREADVTNVLTALRLVGVANVLPMLAQQLGDAPPERLFVGPGRISRRTLLEMLVQPDVGAAVDLLRGSALGAALADATAVALSTQQLSVLERALQRYLLIEARHVMLRDTLGIGLLVGYLALKTAELTNLRLIGYGLAFGDPPATMAEAWIT